MKRFLLALVAFIAVSMVATVKAQSPLSVPDCDNPPQLRASVCPETHGHDLTLKEVIQILAETDIRHGAQQPFFPKAYGATSYQVDPHVIWIFDTGDMGTKRSTVIHELLHVRCHNAGVDCPEDYVDSEEARQYEKLFGVQ